MTAPVFTRGPVVDRADLAARAELAQWERNQRDAHRAAGQGCVILRIDTLAPLDRGPNTVEHMAPATSTVLVAAADRRAVPVGVFALIEAESEDLAMAQYLAWQVTIAAHWARLDAELEGL